MKLVAVQLKMEKLEEGRRQLPTYRAATSPPIVCVAALARCQQLQLSSCLQNQTIYKKPRRLSNCQNESHERILTTSSHPPAAKRNGVKNASSELLLQKNQHFKKNNKRSDDFRRMQLRMLLVQLQQWRLLNCSPKIPTTCNRGSKQTLYLRTSAQNAQHLPQAFEDNGKGRPNQLARQIHKESASHENLVWNVSG